MKKLLLSILTYGFVINSQAQITYPSSEFAAASDSFLITNYTGANLINLDFDTTGAGITWDYSVLGGSTQKVVNYGGNNYATYKASYVASCVAACTAGGGGTIACTNTCNSNWNNLSNLSRPSLDSVNLYALQLEDGVDFLKNTSASLSQKLLAFTANVSGISVPLTIEYDQEDVIYKFPLTYNTTDSSAYSYHIDLSTYGIPFTYVTHRKRMNNTEGWGTLITPYQTYSNTLKLKTIIDRSDSITIDTLSIGQGIMKTVTYSWFALGNGIPVMTASGQIINGVEYITNVSYLDTVRCFDPVALFAYSPIEIYLSGSGDSVAVDFMNFSQNTTSSSWNFGDGVASASYNTTHYYHSAGVFPVQLISCNDICNPERCDTLTLPVVIIDSTQIYASFRYIPAYPCANDTVRFLNTSINYTTSVWDFGDGGTSIQNNPKHTYTNPGTYMVTLITTKTPGGYKDTAYMSISIVGTPEVTASMDQSICLGDTITLSATTTGSRGFMLWWPMAGLSCNLCDQTMASPLTSTNYHVAYYSTCGRAEDSVFVTVTHEPVAAFNESINNQDVTFVNNSADATGYFWDFGDGNTSISSDPQHTYASPGGYSVMLISTNACGVDTVTHTIVVGPNAVNQTNDLKFSLYPNPSNGIYNIISSSNSKASIEVYDMLGKTVYSKNVVLKKNVASPVDMSNAEAGVYFVKINAEGMVKMSKVVIE